jgi:hypothetical protein
MPLLLHALIATCPYYKRTHVAAVERPKFIDRVQTVSMLPRHEVSFTVLANLGRVCQLRLRLERKRLFAS